MSAPSRGARVVDVIGVVVLVVSGALAGLLSTTLVPLYAGSVVVPVAVVIALVANIALPRLTMMIVPRTAVAALPFLAWLVVAIGFGSVARPEGDVILPGDGPGGVVYVTYGVLLVGALAGAATLIVASNPAPPRATQQPPRSGGSSSGKTDRAGRVSR